MSLSSVLQQSLRGNSTMHRALGSIGAASSLLLPKCPLCWMALGLPFAGAGRTQWAFEISGLVLFLLAFWHLLRKSAMPSFTSVVYLIVAATVAAGGAWLMLRWELRLALWILLIVVMPGNLHLFRRSQPSNCACDRNLSDS
jgi:hypothetical protein